MGPEAVIAVSPPTNKDEAGAQSVEAVAQAVPTVEVNDADTTPVGGKNEGSSGDRAAAAARDTSDIPVSTLMVVTMREQVEQSTKALQNLLREISTAQKGMQNIAGMVGGLCEELKSSLPVGPCEDGEDNYVMEPEVAEGGGGFGSYEVMQALHVVLGQVKLLRSAADAVAEDMGDDHGADDILFQAMHATEDATHLSHSLGDRVWS